MSKESAVEILVFKPGDAYVPPDQRGVHENLWIKENFKQYVSVGVYLDGSDLQYYFFEYCDKELYEKPKTYNSLAELKKELGLEKIFDKTPKLFIMGHGHGGRIYGATNVNKHTSVEIYNENFDKVLKDFEEALPEQRDEISVTLEVCNTDHRLEGRGKSFLEKLSTNHPKMTFSGTGPWNPNEEVTGHRSSGGFPTLNVPITSMAGGMWKSGNRVIFYHDDLQVVVKKSMFASKQTAKEIKINTIEYAREVLKETSLDSDAIEQMLSEISSNRDILKLEDLNKVPDFPQTKFDYQKITEFVVEEKRLLEKEKNNYIERVQKMLDRADLGEKFTDRDLLIIAVGLKDFSVSKEHSIFKGHEDLRDKILANKGLLQLVMVTCGKVLIAGPSNDNLIDLLLERGVDINSADEKGMTALHYAVQNFYNYREEPLHLVGKLLDSGASVEVEDKQMRTPMKLAKDHAGNPRIRAAEDLLKLFALHKIINAAHVPAVAYTSVTLKEGSEAEVASTTLTVGKKDAQSTDANNTVNDRTQFPASSISKIVFTYLVLKLVDQSHIKLNDKLNKILPNRRLMVSGEYPDKAENLTVQDVLSHTTGLPNFEADWTPETSSTLSFSEKSELGKGYSYSGEAFYYLQMVVEKVMGRDLEDLAQEYVFGENALDMKDSTFLPQPKRDNIVKVHTDLGKSAFINEDTPGLNVANGAGSLITTAHDFSKFMAAWLSDPTIQRAFKVVDDSAKCGLGWHIYRNNEEVIAYQHGQNTNTQSFMAINVTAKKGAVFFTNSDHGMCMATQILSTPGLAPIGDMRSVIQGELGHSQSDELGWQETLEGKMAEDQGIFEESRNNYEKARVKFEEAGRKYKEACDKSPNDKSKKLRSDWFNEVRQSTVETQAPEQFTGVFTNEYKDRAEISVRDDGLFYKRSGREVKLVPVSKNEFLPEKDQSFRVSFDGDQMIIDDVRGWQYVLNKTQQKISSYATTSQKLGQQPASKAQTESGETPVISSDQYDLGAEKPITEAQERQEQHTAVQDLGEPNPREESAKDSKDDDTQNDTPMKGRF